MQHHGRVPEPADAPSPRAGGLLIALFAVYLVLLAWVVLWKLEVPWIGEAAVRGRPIKLVPFVASGEAGANAPVEVAINLVLFVPFGFYLGLLAPRWRWWRAAGVLLVASLALEIVQHLISTGSFDTTDLIVNTGGGLIGLGLLALLRRRRGEEAAAAATRMCAIVTVLALVAIAVFVASPMHYGPQRDVILPSPSRSR